MYYFPVTMNKIQRGISSHAITLAQFFPLALFHVHLHVNKLLVEQSGNIRIDKGRLSHLFTRSAPRGIAIHKYQFILLFCLCQNLVPAPGGKFYPLCFFQSLLPVPDKRFRFGVTTCQIHELTIPIHENKSGIPRCPVFLCQFLLFTEIQLQIDKILVVKISHFIQREDIFHHHHARLAVIGISIDKNQLLFLLRLHQRLLEPDFLE